MSGFIDDGFRGEPIEAADPAKVFLQWKGTDACFDFECSCGWTGHFDGYFAYAVMCGGCGLTYEMPCYLAPRAITPREEARPVMPSSDEHREPPTAGEPDEPFWTPGEE